MASRVHQRQIEVLVEDLTEKTPLVDGELTEGDLDLLKQLEGIYSDADKIAIKKLSMNDRSWAWPSHSNHQNGFYVPAEFRGTFFPADLDMRPAPNSDKRHILYAEIRTSWPGFPTRGPVSRYRRFTNKDTEAHCTVVPKSAFSEIGPASFIVMGRKRDDQGLRFDCTTVDSNSTVYAMVENLFDLRPSFVAGVFEPPCSDTVPEMIIDELDQFIHELLVAANAGTLPKLISKYRQIPSGADITLKAQDRWLADDPTRTFDPFCLDFPGNVLRELTTEIEFTLYRTHELRYRVAQTLEIIFRDGGSPTMEQIVQRIVRNFLPLYQVILDASQQRKTRVGAGFEAHIKRMLVEGSIPHVDQAVVSTRRPDFVMPTKRLYVSHSQDALVLAAKTTLRERWKQVPMEGRNCTVFLATMDEKVTRSAVREMAKLDITLVVPEAFKTKGTIIEYSKEENVLSFKDFFTKEILMKRKPRWTELGQWDSASVARPATKTVVRRH
jgi:hypothetical protein